jgi:DNA-binding transcriptional LysR family regulator
MLLGDPASEVRIGHEATGGARQVERLLADLDDAEHGLLLHSRRPAGELVVRHARSTLHEFARLKAEVDALGGVKSGLVRIASLDSLFVHVLPQVIERFHRAHPAVRSALEACDPHLIAGRVAEGEADIGISFDLERHAEVGLTADVATPICAMVAAGHPLAGQASTTFVECAPYPLLFQPDTRPTRSIMDAELAAAKTASRPLLVANGLALLKHMVRAGLGVAFCTRIGFVQEIRRGEIVAVPLREPRLAQLRLGLLQPLRRRPSPAVVAMAEHLAAALQELDAGPVREAGGGR